MANLDTFLKTNFFCKTLGAKTYILILVLSYKGLTRFIEIFYFQANMANLDTFFFKCYFCKILGAKTYILSFFLSYKGFKRFLEVFF